MTVTADAPSGAWEQHRVELTAYCYRMLGSSGDSVVAEGDPVCTADSLP
jgi:RNA polymerase sigma-70 factor (ECF subfamily)